MVKWLRYFIMTRETTTVKLLWIAVQSFAVWRKSNSTKSLTSFTLFICKTMETETELYGRFSCFEVLLS